MDSNQRPKRLMFLTGPVEEVEEKFYPLGEEWIVMDLFHHVIENRACVTLTLLPARDVQLAKARSQLEVGGYPHRGKPGLC